MKVEIWSDIVCPFCYIGKRRFEEALAQLPYGHEVEKQFHSFELDPQAPRNPEHDIHDMLAKKYGMSRERAKQMNDSVSEQAQSVGLTYDLDKAIPTNTFDAHRLTHYADKHGKMYEMTERLFKAYFTEGLHVGDREVLAQLAEEVGLDREEAAQVLASDAYTDNVHADQQAARDIGIQGVPFFVINRKYAVSGAQPTEVFIQALEKAKSEEQPAITIVNEVDGADAGEACTDGSCSVDPESK